MCLFKKYNCILEFKRVLLGGMAMLNKKVDNLTILLSKQNLEAGSLDLPRDEDIAPLPVSNVEALGGLDEALAEREVWTICKLLYFTKH